MRLTHGWSLTEAHEPNPAVRFHACHSRALTLIFALALGGCHADIAWVEEGDTDAPAASQLLADVVPSCYFGSPEFAGSPVGHYWGFVYKAQAPNRQRVDLVGGPPLTHIHDLITWVCTGLPTPPIFVLTADNPADLEGFSWQWVDAVPESPILTRWPRVFYEGDLPGPGPLPPPPFPLYWRNLVVELWSSLSSQPLTRATLGVDVCPVIQPLPTPCPPL